MCRGWVWLAGLGGLLSIAEYACAAPGQAPLNVPPWTAAPFLLLLLCIAVLPLVAEHFWHSNLRKALVSAVLGAPVAAYLLLVEKDAGAQALMNALIEYADFMIYLAALYIVSGGIFLQGRLRPSPFKNCAFLALGAVFANFIGTTGASMILIRPVLRMNRLRQNKLHVPIFFIFMVSNVGGLLTPLGDPPLFLGFLRGVDFFWTLSLWPQWLVVNGLVLLIFFFWDVAASLRDPPLPDDEDGMPGTNVLRLRGVFNLLFLGGILTGVFLHQESWQREVTAWAQQQWPDCPELPWGTLLMVMMAFLSWLTSFSLRRANEFTWAPIVEVAVLFAGIFITMVPALEYLKTHRQQLGIEAPWQFFWMTGGLSSFLDNAPTYLTFAVMAAGSDELTQLMGQNPAILAAISCGAVFMGANTYIGNGPNFMVKAIADHSGYPMPSFFGYMLYSVFILLPVFGLVTWLFFWPG